ncbi:unnamed protein product [Dibothriocephalus latus]|uniref:Uncharacterized protein n=1 Tax=Dibothriocephalus latus TaxID=60516 RepID=A0A3P6TPZ9_DIBLA|nr:unnamed protein product [Dibothriocephalus latus]
MTSTPQAQPKAGARECGSIHWLSSSMQLLKVTCNW